MVHVGDFPVTRTRGSSGEVGVMEFGLYSAKPTNPDDENGILVIRPGVY